MTPRRRAPIVGSTATQHNGEERNVRLPERADQLAWGILGATAAATFAVWMFFFPTRSRRNSPGTSIRG